MADIPTLINAIPDVDDGLVITADSHNSIKTALKAIAGALGGSAGGQAAVLSVPPNFFPVAGQTQWNVKIGFAEDSGSSSEGWIPLSLPEGAFLTRFVAMGLKKTVAPTGSVNLLAIPVDGSETTVLASINLNLITVNNPFTQDIPIHVKDAQAGLLTVRNAQFKYVIEANVSLSTAAASVTLYGMQVKYNAP
jgi:hypothetical protein